MHDRRTRWFLVPLALSLVACGSSNGAGATDASTTAAKKPFGATCQADTECAGGLCLRSDYAPFAFCTSRCEIDEEPCPTADGSPSTGFCTRFPDSFTAVDGPICLPLCESVTECTARAPLWERCDPPQYLGQQIYGATSGIRVCGAPSSNGKPVVDGTTCANWADAYRAEYATQVNVCTAYCDYLATCAELDSGSSQDCCGFGCFQRMVDADGELDVPYEKLTKCFVTSFDSRRGTKTRCTAPPEDCDQEPVDPTPK